MGNISRTSILPNKKIKKPLLLYIKKQTEYIIGNPTTEAKHEIHLSNHSSRRVQHIYDICMVRAPAFQIARLMECHFNQLADCFFEYCFQVPANRLGHEVYSVTQLKVIQEVITLAIFIVFSIFYMKEGFHWNHAVGFLLILLAVFSYSKNGINTSRFFLVVNRHSIQNNT